MESGGHSSLKKISADARSFCAFYIHSSVKLKHGLLSFVIQDLSMLEYFAQKQITHPKSFFYFSGRINQRLQWKIALHKHKNFMNPFNPFLPCFLDNQKINVA